MNFSQWLKEAEIAQTQDLPRRFISPDDHFSRSGIDDRIYPFLYTENHKMYYGNQSETHFDIFEYSPELNKEYGKIAKAWIRSPFSKEAVLSRDELEKHILFGRVGLLNYYERSNPHLVVSIWNKSAIVNQLLIPCLNQLEHDGKIDKERDAFSTINHKTQWIKDYLPTTTKIKPEEEKERDKMLALHLMEPKEKMQQLKKQGWTPKQNFWRTSGFVQPGQKYWALNSEGYLQ
jgi:hypothetical protein